VAKRPQDAENSDIVSVIWLCGSALVDLLEARVCTPTLVEYVELGTARVQDGHGNHVKKLEVPTEADYIKGVKAPGKFDAIVGSESEARRIVQQALPNAQELPPGIAGQPYSSPPQGVRSWFQVHPAEPGVGNMLPHIKYADWTGGKKGSGGTWGHLFFPPAQ
jgi:hypothetical protein